MSMQHAYCKWLKKSSREYSMNVIKLTKGYIAGLHITSFDLKLILICMSWSISKFRTCILERWSQRDLKHSWQPHKLSTQVQCGLVNNIPGTTTCTPERADPLKLQHGRHACKNTAKWSDKQEADWRSVVLTYPSTNDGEWNYIRL